MDFIDESAVYVKAGDGGSGCCSFRREKFVPKGGPDGGDGGKGGDVIIRASLNVHTLLDQRYHPHYKGKRGQHGQGKNKTGRGAEDCIIIVPVGTLVKTRETGEILADLDSVDAEYVAARGGAGGRGNARFVSSTMQVPRYCEPGGEGEQVDLRLELKLLADVGLVGYPNAGKSTLISHVSRAKPKIADYPFTTLTPNLGMVAWKDCDFVIADIPGIIEGAHDGVGLGLRFLKHIERTRILCYVLDLSPETGRGVVEEFTVLQQELENYSAELLTRKQLVVLNKCDLSDGQERAEEAVAFLKDKGYPCLMISAATGQGLDELLDTLVRILNEH